MLRVLKLGTDGMSVFKQERCNAIVVNGRDNE